MINGIWGTIAVGLFSVNTVPGYALADAAGNEMTGLFYGGGFELLGIQFIGMIATAAWTTVTVFITFKAIKSTLGLRVSEEDEIKGLDETEHGLTSAYAGFSIMDVTGNIVEANENTDLGIEEYEDASDALRNAAVKVERPVDLPDINTGIHKIVIICKATRYEYLKRAMNELGVTGMTVTQVMGCGIQKGGGDRYRGVEVDATLLPKIKAEIVVSKIPVESVIESAKKALYTGHIGDGKIFVYNIAKVVKIRTGEEDYAALQDVE